jgi:hypothetical protein
MHVLFVDQEKHDVSDKAINSSPWRNYDIWASVIKITYVLEIIMPELVPPTMK